MADFDPNDIIQKPTQGSDFDQADVLHLEQGQDFHPDDVIATSPPPEQKGVEDIEKRSFWSAPVLGTEPTTDKELEAIAAKHGVDPDLVKSFATYAGAHREGEGQDTAGELESAIGRGIGLGVPQFIAKKQLEDPKARQAFDEVRELANQKRSFAQGLAENVLPLGLAGRAVSAVGRGAESLGKAAVKGAAEGAGIGAVAGGANSEEGKEGRGAIQGAELGAGLGAVGSALAAKFSGKAGSAAEKSVVDSVLDRQGPELEKGTEDLLKTRQASEDAIQNIINDNAKLTPEAADTIVKEQLDPERLTQYLDPASEEGKIARERLARDMPEVQNVEDGIKQQLAQDIVDTRARDFAEQLSGDRPKSLEQAQGVIKEYASRQGEEATAAKYRLAAEEKAALDYIEQNAIRGGRANNFGNKALNWLSDAQFVLRDIDNRLGTKLEPIQRDMSAQASKMSFARNDAREALNMIYKDAPKEVDQEITAGRKLYDALDSGNFSNLSPAEEKIAREFQTYFEQQRQFVNDAARGQEGAAPLSIPKQENYVPHMLLPTEELTKKVDQGVGAILKQASEQFGRPITDFAQLKPSEWAQVQRMPAVEELTRGLQIFDNRGVKTAQDMSARLKDTFFSKAGRLRLDTKARAAMERTGDIPGWMRETNLYKLADAWSSQTLKHLYLRKQVDQMRSMLPRLEKMGADLEANYVRNLLADINGRREGTVSSFVRETELRYYRALDQLADQYPNNLLVKGTVIGAKAIPTVLGDLTKQIYPNMLGLSPRAMIMNMSQSVAKTMPELGGRYGVTAVLRGAMHAVLNAPEMLQLIEREGLVPAEYVGQYRQAVAEGILRTNLYGKSMQLVNGMGKAALYLYDKMEKVNRIVTRSTAEVMAHDLAQGNKLAQQTLEKNFPPALVRQVRNAASPGEVAQLIGQHLNASTQYNYNRISMSEYGRTMGNLFSPFSKWPSATLGEMILEQRTRGAVGGTFRNAEKFIAPFLLFKGVDYLLNDADPDKQSDRQRLLLGYGGLAGSAPIGSAGAILKGDFFTPPAIDAITKGLIVPLLNRDDSKLQNGLSSALQNFTPGSVAARVITDDLPTMITGHRPAGSNFIERTEHGARKLMK